MQDDERLEACDPRFHQGAVEDGGKDDIEQQILPVWASTEPFGYAGGPADLQVAGGGGGGLRPDAGEAIADREIIGPEGD